MGEQDTIERAASGFFRQTLQDTVAMAAEQPLVTNDASSRLSLIVGKDMSGMCIMGCGLPVRPGVTRKGQPWTTCCRGCATGFGHDLTCGTHTSLATLPE